MKLERYFRMKELVDALGVSRSTLYSLMKSGQFPAPIKLSPRTSVWSAEATDEFVRARGPVSKSLAAHQLGEAPQREA